MIVLKAFVGNESLCYISGKKYISRKRLFFSFETDDILAQIVYIDLYELYQRRIIFLEIIFLLNAFTK
jgi:hypothetical protein